MTDSPPLTYDQINRLIFEAANNLRKTGRLGGLWRKLPSRRIERGEAYLKESRTLILHCRRLMEPEDYDTSEAAFNAARNKREEMRIKGVSIVRSFRDAIEFEDLSKEAFFTAKIASDRGLDNMVLGRMGPPGGVPPATPEEPDGTDPPAGASPGTPGEPSRPPSPDCSADSHAATVGSIAEWIQGIGIALPLEDANFRGPIDDASETYSFVYDPSLATSGTSIASYKTEKTVNSRKSRYNERPRHKYADCGHLRPQGLMPLDVDHASILELMDEQVEPLSSPPSARQTFPKPGLVQESKPGPSHGTQPLDGPHAALPITMYLHWDTETQPPSPRQGNGFLTASQPPETSAHGRAAGAREVGSLGDFEHLSEDEH